MQAQWSAIAGKFKSGLDHWRAIAGVAGVLGAIFVTAAASLSAVDDSAAGARTALGLAGAIVLAGVPIAVTRTTKDHIQDWVRARAASEGLKEHIWRFLAGGKPYGQQRDARQFLDARDRIVAGVEDLVSKAGHVTPRISTRPTAPVTVEEFITGRLEDQVKYYGRSSDTNAQKAAFWRNVSFGLGLVAAIAGVVSGGTAGGLKIEVPAWLTGIGPWVAVLTTASAAVTAHLNAQRFDELAVSYASTARKLKRLRADFRINPAKGQPEQVESFVEEVESLLAAENGAWRATMTEDKKPESRE